MNKTQLRERLKKPLQLELTTGCQDTAVVGGIEKLITTVGKPFADIGMMVERYAQLSVAERQERLEQVLALLEKTGLEKAERTETQKNIGQETDQEGSEKREEKARNPSALDEELTQQLVDLGGPSRKKTVSGWNP